MVLAKAVPPWPKTPEPLVYELQFEVFAARPVGKLKAMIDPELFPTVWTKLC